MRFVMIPALVLALLATPREASAWGFEAHKYIASRVIALLPAEIRPYFEKHREVFIERAIDPDLWRNAGYDLESPHHYLDMDAYGPHPFTALPHDYDAAVKKYGKDFVDKNGTLPWRAEDMFSRLVEAFTQKGGYSRDNIKFYAAWLAHYTCDAHVPFHAALNHDGQLTGQWGLHARFESEAFERFRDKLTVMPGPVVPIASAREFIFKTLTESFTYVQPILDADRQAVKGKDVYDDEYFARFIGKIKPIMEQRLADSIAHTAGMITAAWVAAGRPAVPPDTPSRATRKVRRGIPHP
jgi:hypothetical protein